MRNRADRGRLLPARAQLSASEAVRPEPPPWTSRTITHTLLAGILIRALMEWIVIMALDLMEGWIVTMAMDPMGVRDPWIPT